MEILISPASFSDIIQDSATGHRRFFTVRPVGNVAKMDEDPIFQAYRKDAPS
jgi:hypothetical protein